MTWLPWKQLVIGLVIALVAAFLFLGIDALPFHPDETSWLVQSQDLERFASDPISMAYTSQARLPAEMAYRLLNAPAAKYTLAIGRRFAGYGPSTLPADWDWTASWEVNRQRGAIPSPGLLQSARLASTALIALSLLPLFAVGRRLGGTGTGVVTVALLATNALVLLHGRRAMAEGALILAVSLVMAGVLWGDRHPWLAGLSLGLALATKQSTLPLLPVGLLGVGWSSALPDRSRGSTWIRLATCCVTLTVVWAILNPVAWRRPLETTTAMIAERRQLVADQIADFGASGGLQVMDSAAERASGLIASLYFAEPQVREAGNYDVALGTAQRAYLEQSATHLGRGLVGGAITLLLALLGMALGLRRLGSAAAAVRRDAALMLLLTLVQTAALLAAVPLAFQRYYLPLVPTLCVWIALALTESVRILRSGPAKSSSAAAT
ncbi:MAG: hypothetical protein MUO23_02350 [Anaerolineales bacterium]|nr:hypothetical protein [Anaerolineales bacterium]